MSDSLSGSGLLVRLHRRLVGERGPRVQFECRRCGRTLAEAEGACPDCGASDVARYEF